MSQVMQALKQSEQAYQAQMPASNGPLRQPASMRAEKRSHYIKATLFVLPLLVVAAMVYPMLIKTKERPQLEAISQSSMAADLGSLQGIKREDPVAQRLSYPELKTLRPLPGSFIVDSRASAAAKPIVKPLVAKQSVSHNTSVPTPVTTNADNSNQSSTGKIIQTDQVNVNDGREDWNVDHLDLSGLSPELAEKFQSALQAHPDSVGASAKRKPSSQQLSDAINLVGNETRFRGRLPAMNFETHMYSSRADSRWIKVNGKNVHEGEWIIDPVVKLQQILPGSLLIQFDNHIIQIPALYEWAG